MTRKKDPTEKLKDRAAASPEVVEDVVDSEKDRKLREDFLSRLGDIHDELTDLQNETHGTGHEDIHGFVKSIIRQVRVSPFGRIGGSDNKSPLG